LVGRIGWLGLFTFAPSDRDGGTVNPVPCDLLFEGRDIVIGLEIPCDKPF
jgi:hypothetical protein